MNQTLIDWSKNNLIPRKTINNDYDTSQIREAFIHDTGVYVDNAEVNDAA